MSLNKSGIEWTEYTWNPIVGCKHGCWYCYARELATTRLAKMPNACPKCATFEPHFHEERLLYAQQRKTPSTILVGSMCDMWGDWVPPHWIEDTLCAMMYADDVDVSDDPSPHTFLTLTKNPQRYSEFQQMMPENLWLGVTITCLKDFTGRYHYMLPRHKYFPHRPTIKKRNKQFLSLEPLLDDPFANGQIRWEHALREKFDAIIIGPLNKPGQNPFTKREWVENIIGIAREAEVPVFLKKECVKLGYTMEEMESRGLRELPWNLHT